MANNSNYHRGSGAYKCTCCEKLTRETGNGESHCRLCVDCHELAGIENFLCDNGTGPTCHEYGNVVKDAFARRPQLKKLFPELDLALVVGDQHEHEPSEVE